ncbi:MAG: thioesterase family protein [Pseudomonadota bacterium]
MDQTESRPIRTAEQRVPADWIDYNGHMNVAYYIMAFDRALDEVYEALEFGAVSARVHRMGPMALQSQIHYLGELLEGTRFVCDVRVLDADAKRIHIFGEMRNLDAGESLAATYESLSVNVDLEARRSAPFRPQTAALVEAMRVAHAALPRPAQAGAALGIRRKPPGAA